MQVKDVLLRAGEGQKTVVGPDDLPVVRPEHRHGQGGVEHTVLADGVHAAGDGLDILHDRAPAAAALTAVEDVERRERDPLHPRQDRLDGHRDGGEQGKAEEIGL